MNRRRFCQTTLAASVAAALPPWYGYAAESDLAAEILAITGRGDEIAIQRSDLQQLRAGLRGRLLLPDSEGYEQARRLRNPSIDKRPALIAQCLGAGDVQQAVNFARSHQLLTAVKCGGHNVAGKGSCDAGLMIDLSPLQGVRVDPKARTAQVAGGSLLGSMDEEAQAFGLVTTAGTVSHTGVGGLTLGGGFGRLARRFGLASDNVRAVDIITADGEFRHASAEENSDLLWGVRGGGGNFGVVTSFEFQLHPMQRDVIGGNIVFPFSQAKQLLKAYAEFSTNAPDELYTDFMILAPPGGGDPMVMFNVCYSGAQHEADRVLAPLRKAGKPIADRLKTMPYVAQQKSGDDASSADADARAIGQYLKGGFITEIPGALIDNLVDNLELHPDRGTLVYLQQSGGAISRVAVDATAFPHRDSQHNLFTTTLWALGQDPSAHISRGREYWKLLDPFTKGFYTNDYIEKSEREVTNNYFGNYARLVQVKTKYDPTNLFQLNANIAPAAG